MLRLAGQIGDGAIVTGCGRDSPRLRAMLDCLRAARATAAPDRAFRTCLHVPAAVHPDRRQAYAAVHPQVAVGLLGPHWPVSEAAEQAGAKLRASYDYYQHMSSQTRYADLIPDEVVPDFALAGTPDDCVPALRGLLALGLDEISLVPYAVDGGSRADMIAALARDVIAPARAR
jgi:5,10-methylenetetrahydromethanopterin reductase